MQQVFTSSDGDRTVEVEVVPAGRRHVFQHGKLKPVNWKDFTLVTSRLKLRYPDPPSPSRPTEIQRVLQQNEAVSFMLSPVPFAGDLGLVMPWCGICLGNVAQAVADKQMTLAEAFLMTDFLDQLNSYDAWLRHRKNKADTLGLMRFALNNMLKSEPLTR